MGAELVELLEEDFLEMDQAETANLPATIQIVSDDEFERTATGAVEAFSGTLLFRMKTGEGLDACHVATAFVDEAGERHFVILTQSVAGGELRVEAASKSENPVASIIPAYADVLETFAAAA
ncbi:hypothetical protein ABFT80_21165 [Mesorhizobium sp. SB112]|uniref:hypothetical protein n=1 Tax=Mesorhizobium sp. SB112 TaxID=3151853 RepID=UPI003266D48F